MPIPWQQLWLDLNDRQRHFLKTLYAEEESRAAYYNSQRAMFDPLKKGAAWRWMVHNPPGGGGLQRILKEEEQYDPGTGKRGKVDKKLLNNQGSGSTYKTLEEAGYLDRRWDLKEMYSIAYGKRTVQILSVRLTPRGRKLTKMFFYDTPEEVLSAEAKSSAKTDAEDDTPPDMTDELMAKMQAACNPEGHVDVPLPGGGHARVSPNASPELLAALTSLEEAAHAAATVS